MDESKFRATVPEDTGKDTTNSFPIQVFPKFFQGMLRALEGETQLPIEYFAAAFLSAVSAAIGRKIVIQRSDGLYKNKAMLWIALVGPSGAGKTFPTQYLFKYLSDKDIEEDLKRREEIKKREKEDPENTKTEIPPRRKRIIRKATPEAIYKLIEEGNSLTIIRDELLGFVREFGQYSHGRSGEEQIWMSMWSDENLSIDTRHQDQINTKNSFLSIIGGIQSDLLKKFLTTERLESGFAQRFLYVIPDHFKPQEYSFNRLDESLEREYEQLLNEIFELPEKTILLRGEIEKIYADFYNKNSKLKFNETSAFLQKCYSKLDIYFLRLALILHVIYCFTDGKDLEQIDPKAANNAELLCEYFRENSKKIERILKEDGSNMPTKEIIKILASKGRYTDAEIAKIAKVSESYVRKIRKESDLPPKKEIERLKSNVMDL